MVTFAIRVNEGPAPTELSEIRNTAVVNLEADANIAQPELRSDEEDSFEVPIAVPSSLDKRDEPGVPSVDMLPEFYLPVVQ